MKQLLTILLVLAAAVLQVGCTNDATGTWAGTGPYSSSLELYKVKDSSPTYLVLSGAIGLLAVVDGNTIDMGTITKGTISGNKMIFPERGGGAGWFSGT